MKVTESKLDGCCLIQPDIYSDERGFFLESYNIKKYIDIIGEDTTFVQDNHSKSSQGVLRGLHFQKKNPQGKLVRVVQGEVYDVVVDIRKNSKTFGQHESFILSSENNSQLWVPKGFAHGFQVISKTAEFLYKCTDFYDPNDEGCIIWNDSSLNIDWPIKGPILSDKDSKALSFSILE